jgi:hypothetical protein
MKMILYIALTVAIPACAGSPEDPELRTPAIASMTSELGNQCTIQCNNANVQCNATCERFPRPGCEDKCDQRFLNCMATCGCPFNNEFDRTVFDHATRTVGTLCVGPPFSPGVIYQRYNLFTRTEHVRETLQCDGSISQVVLSSTVSAPQVCFHDDFFPSSLSCPNSQVSLTGICSF